MMYCPICMASLIAETKTVCIDDYGAEFVDVGTGKFACSSCDLVFEIQILSSDEDWIEK